VTAYFTLAETLDEDFDDDALDLVARARRWRALATHPDSWNSVTSYDHLGGMGPWRETSLLLLKKMTARAPAEEPRERQRERVPPSPSREMRRVKIIRWEHRGGMVRYLHEGDDPGDEWIRDDSLGMAQWVPA